MKTIADLKRKLKVGTKLRTISPGSRHHNLVRIITISNSVGIALSYDGVTNLSYLPWPKKSEIEFINDKTFIVSFEDTPGFKLQYEIVGEN